MERSEINHHIAETMDFWGDLALMISTNNSPDFSGQLLPKSPGQYVPHKD